MAGSVYRRGKTWTYVIDLPKVDGKRRQHSVGGFATEELADLALAKRKIELYQGIGTRPYGGTVAEFCERWLAGLAVYDSTYASYRESVNHYIVPHLGHLLVGKLDPADVAQWHRALQGRELAANTIRQAHRVLSIALRTGMTYGELSRNVAVMVRPPRPEQAEMAYWEPESVVAFVAHCSDDARALPALIMLGAGLRPGEALGLHWDDIDIRRRMIAVRGTLSWTREGGVRVARRAKTESSARTVRIDPDLVAVLQREQDRARLRGTAAGLVTTTRNGGLMRHAQYRDMFRRLCRAAKVDEIRLHDLRHTHATMLIYAGVDIKTISVRLGHASVAFTLDQYGHVLERMEEHAAESIGAIMQGRLAGG